MDRKYNLGAFILCLIVLMLALQALYASSDSTWQVAPPALALWILTVIIFIMAIMGF